MDIEETGGVEYLFYSDIFLLYFSPLFDMIISLRHHWPLESFTYHSLTSISTFLFT
jgi:hypothetical protein